MKLKQPLPCPALPCVLTRTAFIFGSLNSFKILIISAFSPRLWVSESVSIVYVLSPARPLLCGCRMAGPGGRQGHHPAQRRLLLLLTAHQGSVELRALTACLWAANPKGKTGRQVALDTEGRGFSCFAEEFRKTR